MSTDQRRNERAGETGDPRGNLVTSDIVRHDSHVNAIRRLQQLLLSLRGEGCVRFTAAGSRLIRSNALSEEEIAFVVKPRDPDILRSSTLASSSAYWSLGCVSIGCCPTHGSYGVRKELPCKSAIGSEACRMGLINCDPIAKPNPWTAYLRRNGGSFDVLHTPRLRGMHAVLQVWAPRGCYSPRKSGLSSPPLYFTLIILISLTTRNQSSCSRNDSEWAPVAERLARSPPTKANLVQSPAGSPDFCKWESCRTMPLTRQSDCLSMRYYLGRPDTTLHIGLCATSLACSAVSVHVSPKGTWLTFFRSHLPAWLAQRSLTVTCGELLQDKLALAVCCTLLAAGLHFHHQPYLCLREMLLKYHSLAAQAATGPSVRQSLVYVLVYKQRGKVKAVPGDVTGSPRLRARPRLVPQPSVFLINSSPGRVTCPAPPRCSTSITARIPSRQTGFNPRPSHSLIFASGNRAGRCRCLAGFLEVLLFPLPFQFDAALYSPKSPSLALKTSLLGTAQISSFTLSALIEGSLTENRFFGGMKASARLEMLAYLNDLSRTEKWGRSSPVARASDKGADVAQWLENPILGPQLVRARAPNSGAAVGDWVEHPIVGPQQPSG
ncbi:hypothetical protein PR048_001831 [Dryococelus australis]|uniref:Uncharacterized protein n=1 Tax=Dryococelus australis TaxID=614101 RepID=A0ABQ9IIK2_9NEOP|nr:hypothetical protein PR048_001831 [Dryococelus australis]